MTRDEIKKGPIYITNYADSPIYIFISYRSGTQPLKGVKPDGDGSYSSGKGFNLWFKDLDNTETFDELIERALDLMIDDLEANQGLDNILSLERMEIGKEIKLLKEENNVKE
jgi:hypothetical protein